MWFQNAASQVTETCTTCSSAVNARWLWPHAACCAYLPSCRRPPPPYIWQFMSLVQQCVRCITLPALGPVRRCRAADSLRPQARRGRIFLSLKGPFFFSLSLGLPREKFPLSFQQAIQKTSHRGRSPCVWLSECLAGGGTVCPSGSCQCFSVTGGNVCVRFHSPPRWCVAKIVYCICRLHGSWVSTVFTIIKSRSNGTWLLQSDDDYTHRTGSALLFRWEITAAHQPGLIIAESFHVLYSWATFILR